MQISHNEIDDMDFNDMELGQNPIPGYQSVRRYQKEGFATAEDYALAKTSEVYRKTVEELHEDHGNIMHMLSYAVFLEMADEEVEEVSLYSYPKKPDDDSDYDSNGGNAAFYASQFNGRVIEH